MESTKVELHTTETIDYIVPLPMFTAVLPTLHRHQNITYEPIHRDGIVGDIDMLIRGVADSSLESLLAATPGSVRVVRHLTIARTTNTTVIDTGRIRHGEVVSTYRAEFGIACCHAVPNSASHVETPCRIRHRMLRLVPSSDAHSHPKVITEHMIPVFMTSQPTLGSLLSIVTLLAPEVWLC